MTGGEVPLFHPRTQHWWDHFAWAEDLRTLLGLTAAGRATIPVPAMNNELHRAAGPFWFAVGLLPQPLFGAALLTPVAHRALMRWAEG